MNLLAGMALNRGQATCFLTATHHIVMIIICGKLIINPTIYDKVMGRTPTGFTETCAQCLGAACDLDL